MGGGGVTAAHYMIKFLRSRHGSKYYVIAARDVNMLQVGRLEELPPPPKCFVKSLDYFLDPLCVTFRLEQYMNRLLSEREFVSAMRKYIRKCFVDKELVARRLDRLKDFVSMAKSGKIKYPYVTRPYDPDIKRILAEGGIIYRLDYEDNSWIDVYMLRDSFIVIIVPRDVAILLPYDVRLVDPKAVAELSSNIVRALRKIVEYAEGSSILERALDVLRYIMFVREVVR